MFALLQEGCGPDVNALAASTDKSAVYQSIVRKQEAAARRLVMYVRSRCQNFGDCADDADPLIAAVRAGYDDIVRDLLIAGADPYVHHCGTPLHAAVERGLASTVSVLLSSPKTDKNALNNDERSPLTMASYLGRGFRCPRTGRFGSVAALLDPCALRKKERGDSHAWSSMV
ncbi:unnamed protein product [Ectocarpus sp. 13 AM-2016]